LWNVYYKGTLLISINNDGFHLLPTALRYYSQGIFDLIDNLGVKPQ